MTKTTQAAQLVRAIRRNRQGMTYGELADVRWPDGSRVSTCGHKRLAEAAHLFLRPHEQLTRTPRKSDGLVVFRVVRCATNWTA